MNAEAFADGADLERGFDSIRRTGVENERAMSETSEAWMHRLQFVAPARDAMKLKSAVRPRLRRITEAFADQRHAGSWNHGAACVKDYALHLGIIEANCSKRGE